MAPTGDDRGRSLAVSDRFGIGRRGWQAANMGYGSMRGTVTEGLFSEWLKWRVEWRFLGLEREDPVQVKIRTRPDRVGVNVTGVCGTQSLLTLYVWATRLTDLLVAQLKTNKKGKSKPAP
jgi:hypothetical protein